MCKSLNIVAANPKHEYTGCVSVVARLIACFNLSELSVPCTSYVCRQHRGKGSLSASTPPMYCVTFCDIMFILSFLGCMWIFLSSCVVPKMTVLLPKRVRHKCVPNRTRSDESAKHAWHFVAFPIKVSEKTCSAKGTVMWGFEDRGRSYPY
jgi:hypothetical protein